MVCPYSPMNRISSAVLLLLAAAVCSPARAESWGEGIAGFYVTVDGGAQVRVTRASDGSYTGTIVWLRSDKNRLDKNNPDPGRKGDRVLGLVILRELRANDKTYDAFIWRDPDKPGILFLKGYVFGITWLGRSTTWTEEKKLRE